MSRRALLILVLTSCTVSAAAEEDRARRALALVEIERARSVATTPKKIDPPSSPVAECHTDYNEALAEAVRKSAPLVCWVGIKCVEKPELRARLKDCVHCHLADWNGDKGPFLVIRTPSGDFYRVRSFDYDAVRDVIPVKKKAAAPPQASPYYVYLPTPAATSYPQSASPAYCRT